jgi:hypothetical protein
MSNLPDYGLWQLVIINSVIFLIFVFSMPSMPKISRVLFPGFDGFSVRYAPVCS